MGSVDARNWMLLVLSNAGKVGEGFRYLIMMFSHLFSLDTTLEVCFSNEICWKNSVPCNSLLLFAIEDYFEWLSCKFCWKRGRKYHCLLFYHVFVLATLCRVWIVFFFFCLDDSTCPASLVFSFTRSAIKGPWDLLLVTLEHHLRKRWNHRTKFPNQILKKKKKKKEEMTFQPIRKVSHRTRHRLQKPCFFFVVEFL